MYFEKYIPVGTGLAVQEGETTRDLTWAEWDAAFPAFEPIEMHRRKRDTLCLWDWRDAKEVMRQIGLYEILHEDGPGIETSQQVIVPLRAAAAQLKESPEVYRDLMGGERDFNVFVEYLENMINTFETEPEWKPMRS